MINIFEVNETNNMIEQESLDVRTITLGISLLDCCDADLETLNQKIYNKITTVAKDLVKTGEDIELSYGIPIVNKRISVTPIALVGGQACRTPEDFVTIARTLDAAAKATGVNFLGGYSALVSKGMTAADENGGKLPRRERKGEARDEVRHLALRNRIVVDAHPVAVTLYHPERRDEQEVLFERDARRGLLYVILRLRSVHAAVTFGE